MRGVTLVSDLSDLSDLSDKRVRHGIPRGGLLCRCLVWLGWQIYRRGMPGFFDGNGGVRVAWA